ncbi:MAG: CoA ester lyase [Actinomycetota bacterium]|nr:CoA ester lyase [Actinomycetota bacterium]
MPSVDEVAPRSMLFMPADKPSMARKIPMIAPDLAVLDLEDAVAMDAKAAARDVLAETLAETVANRAVRGGSIAIAVRVNEVDSPWFADDLALARDAGGSEGGRIGVVVPKVESASTVDRVRAALGDVLLVAGLESGLGVADARAILGAGVDGCFFGAEDYVVDVGGRRTSAGAEVLYARSQVLLAAAITGSFAIDQAIVAIHDDDLFRADATRGREIGYGGKICLHPRQVELAHELFSPSPAEVEHARRVIEVAETGGGVGTVDGVMVDHVHVRQARAVLARAGS